MKYKATIVALLVILAIVMINSSSNSGDDEGIVLSSDSSPIKIGFIGALSGTAASYGESQRDGVALAIEEINKKGGVDGRKLELILEDGQCRGEPAASAASKLINVDQVHYIVGGSCSTEVLSYLPIVDPAEVVTIISTASNFRITDTSEYIFRHVPHDNYLGERLAEFVVEDYTRLAVITENLDFPIGLRDPLIPRYQELGGEIVANETYPADDTDFRTVLTRIAATKPEALFINSQSDSTAARIAKQAREIGLDAQLYAAYWTGPGYVESGSAVEGSIIISTPQLDLKEKDAASFVNSHKEHFGRGPNYPYYAAAAYDSVYVIAESIREVGDDPTKVRDYLHRMPPYKGAAATYEYDFRGDSQDLELSLLQVRDGKAILLAP